ncbi:MAG: sel1 repeat family protein, partial [Clostridiales bacterium]|nr:sel1 repeat family protein [Clostridiales bacterium]
MGLFSKKEKSSDELFQEGLDAYNAQKYKKALDCWMKAAEKGDVTAANNIGVLYANGLGVAKDEAKASSWFEKAAQQGYANAQYYLAARYANGRGVAKDTAKAAFWYEKAAQQG